MKPAVSYTAKWNLTQVSGVFIQTAQTWHSAGVVLLYNYRVHYRLHIYPCMGSFTSLA